MLIAQFSEPIRKRVHFTAARPNRTQRFGLERIVGQSPAMLELLDRAARAALTDCTVLVTGERGTGKSLLAETIHWSSRRKENAFVNVNVAAVPRHAIESELFGHLQGAFEGAIDSRLGQLVLASGGTIFLDGIADLPLAPQAKLLRALEQGGVCPIGGNADHPIDVRLIAGTHSELSSKVQSKQFREDLYFRLSVVNLVLPPLRNRRTDIPLLIRHFLFEFCEAVNRPIPELDAGLWEFLQTHDWPGNVGQLRNCLECMILSTAGNGKRTRNNNILTTMDLPRAMRQPDLLSGQAKIPANMTLADLERQAILQALDQNGMNRTRAASSLGISLRTLQRKLKRWKF